MMTSLIQCQIHSHYKNRHPCQHNVKLVGFMVASAFLTLVLVLAVSSFLLCAVQRG